VPEVAPPDHFYNGPYQNGIFVCWMVDWAGAAAAHEKRTGTDLVLEGSHGLEVFVNRPRRSENLRESDSSVTASCDFWWFTQAG
jgi:hypothetical protein